MGAQLNPAGGFWRHLRLTGCGGTPALVYAQVIKLEPVSQAFKPVTCGVVGEPIQYGSEVDHQ